MDMSCNSKYNGGVGDWKTVCTEEKLNIVIDDMLESRDITEDVPTDCNPMDMNCNALAPRCNPRVGEKLYTNSSISAHIGYWKPQYGQYTQPAPSKMIRNIRKNFPFWFFEQFNPYIDVTATVTYCLEPDQGEGVAIKYADDEIMWIANTKPWMKKPPNESEKRLEIAIDGKPGAPPALRITGTAHFEKCPWLNTGSSVGVSTTGVSGGIFQNIQCTDGYDGFIKIDLYPSTPPKGKFEIQISPDLSSQ